MIPAPNPASPGRDPAESLLARVAGGDEGALRTLFDTLSPRVHGLCLRVLGDRSAAEEATLDAFHQVWRQAERFDPGRGSATAWILTLARTRALDLLRTRTRRTGREHPLDTAAGATTSDPGPDTLAGSTLRAGRVRSALALLSADQRAAIEKAFFEGLTHTEIAESLRAPLGTVKTRIRTGLETMRAALATEEGIA